MRYLNLFFIAFLCYGCGNDNELPTEALLTSTTQASAAEQLPSYPTQEIVIEDVSQPIRVTGRVVPMQEATIASQVPGLVLPTEKLLQVGKFYRQGETMINIDNEQLRLGLKAERSSFVTSLIQILSDLSLDYAADYPKWEKFTKSIKADEFLPPMPVIANDQLNYFVASRGIPAQYYGIQQKEALLDDYTIRAPFSGRLTMASVEPGSYVSPGAPLARISRTDVYEVQAAIPALAVADDRVKEGQKIGIDVRDTGGTYVGTINRFATNLDEGTQSVTAFIRVNSAALRTGMYIEAELPGKNLRQVAVLPKEALLRDNTVYVIVDGIVRQKAVEVAFLDATNVYLQGLDNGDRVIIQSVEKSIVGSRAK